MFSPQSFASDHARQQQTWVSSQRTQRSPSIAITLNNLHRQPPQERPEAAHLLVGTRKRMLKSIDTGYKNKLEDKNKIQRKYNFVKNRLVQNKKSPSYMNSRNTSGFPSKRPKSKVTTLQTETNVLTPKSQRQAYNNLNKKQPKLKLQIQNAQKSMDEEDPLEINTKLSAEIRIQSAKNPTQVQLMGSSISEKEQEINKSKGEQNINNISAQSPHSPHHQLQPMNHSNRSRNDQVEFDANQNKNLDTMKITDEVKMESMTPHAKNQTFEAVRLTDTLQKQKEKGEQSSFVKIEENNGKKSIDSLKRQKSPLNKAKSFNYGQNRINSAKNAASNKKTSPSLQSRKSKQQETINAETNLKNINSGIKKESGQHGLVLTALEEEFRKQTEDDENVIILDDQNDEDVAGGDYTITEEDDSLMSLGLGLGIKVPSHLVQNKRIKSAGFRQKYREQQDREQRMRLCKQQQKFGKTRVSHQIQTYPNASMTVPNNKAQQIKFYYAENLKNFNPKGDAEIEQQLVVQTSIRNQRLQKMQTNYTSKAILQQASMSQTGGFLVSTKDLMQKQSSDGFAKFHKLAAESPGNVNPVLNNKRIKSANPAGRAARGGIMASMKGLVNQMQSHRLLKESTSVANPLLMARKSMPKGNVDLKTLQINQNSEKNLFLESVKVLTMNPSIKNSKVNLMKSQEKQRSPSIPKIEIPNQQFYAEKITEQDAQGTIGVSSVDISAKIGQNGKPMSITTEMNQNVNSQIISSPVASEQPIQISSTGIGQYSNNNQGIEEPPIKIQTRNHIHHTQENVADLSAQIYNNDYKPMNSPVGSYGSPPIDSNRLIYVTNENLQASFNMSRQASMAIHHLSQKSQLALNQNHSTASRKSVLKKVFRKNRSNESFEKVMISDDTPIKQDHSSRSAKRKSGRSKYSQDNNSANKGLENKHIKDLNQKVQPFELENYFAHEIELQDNNQESKPMMMNNQNQMELLIQNLDQNKSSKIFQQPTLSSNLPKRMMITDFLQPVRIIDQKTTFYPNGDLQFGLEADELQQVRPASGSMGKTNKKNRNENNRESQKNLKRGTSNKKIANKHKRKIIVQGDANENASDFKHSGQEFRTLRNTGFPTPNMHGNLQQTQQLQTSIDQPGREQFLNSIHNLQLNVNSAADSQSNLDNMRSYNHPKNPSSRAPSSRQSIAKHLVTRQFRNRPMTSKTRPNVAALPGDLSKGAQQFQSTNFLINVNQPIEELDEQNNQQKSQDTNKNPLKVVGGQFMEIISNSLTDKSSQPAINMQNNVIMEAPSPTSKQGRNHNNIFGIQTIQPLNTYTKSKGSQQSNNTNILNHRYQQNIKSKQTSLDMIKPGPLKKDGATQKYENSQETSDANADFNFLVLPTQTPKEQTDSLPNPKFQKQSQINKYCQLFTRINRGPNDQFGSINADYNFNFSNPNSRRLSNKSNTHVKKNIDKIRIMSARNHGRKEKQLQKLVHDHYHKAYDQHGMQINEDKSRGKGHNNNMGTRGSTQFNESAQYRMMDQNVTPNYGFEQKNEEMSTKVLYSNAKNKVVQQQETEQESTSKFEERSSIANGLNQQYDFSKESNSVNANQSKENFQNQKLGHNSNKKLNPQRRTQTKLRGDQHVSTQEGNAATSQHPTELVQIDSEEQDHVGMDRPFVEGPSGSIQQYNIENNDQAIGGQSQQPSKVDRDSIITVGVGQIDKMIQNTDAQQASRQQTKLPAKTYLAVKRKTFSEQSDLL